MTDIHPTSVVEPGAQIDDDAKIGPFCFVGPNVTIGAGTRLISHVVVTGHTQAGANNVIWPHTTLGGYPQDLGYKGEPTELLIGDNNVIRESVTMHVGSPKGGGVTRVGSDNFIMVGVHVAHDCQVGSHVVMANNILMAGHVHVEDHVVMGGGSAFHHFTTVGQYAFISGLTRVMHDVPPYMIVDGCPSRPRVINRVGLTRGGFSPEQLERLETASRRLYHQRQDAEGLSTNMDQRLADLEREFPDDPHVRNLVTAARNSMSGPHGRYRELFR